MAFLLTSLLALFLGPLLARAFRRSDRVLAALDGFVIAAILGLVVLHILPHAVALGGLPVMAAAVAGLLLPSLVERRLPTRGAGRASRGVILLIAVGLAVHAALDGAALALPGDPAGEEAGGVLLAFGVLLHRVPEGLAVWGAAKPLWGTAGALALIALIAVATSVGFGYGGGLLTELSGPFLGAFEALVAGTLLHVVVGHRLPALASASPHRAIAAAGAIVGVVGHLLLLDTHAIPEASAGLPAGLTFSTLALRAAPALFIGLAAVAAAAWLSPRLGRAWQSARPLVGAARAAAGGIIGLAIGSTAATTGGSPQRPALGPLALVLSLPLLGPAVTLGRVTAVLAVLIVMALLRRSPGSPPSSPPGDWRASLLATIDHETPWFVTGVALAAMLEPVLPCSFLDGLPAPWQAVVAVAVAAPWYLSAAGMTPLAAVMLHKGAAPGAVIAFLVVGATVALRAPACDHLEHPRAPRREVAVIIAISLVSAWLIDAIFPGSDFVALHHTASLAPGAVALAAATGLALLTLTVLVRRGPRGFIAQITGHGEDAHDDHAHGHDHGHDQQDPHAPHAPDNDHEHGPHDHDHGHPTIVAADVVGAADPSGPAPEVVPQA